MAAPPSASALGEGVCVCVRVCVFMFLFCASVSACVFSGVFALACFAWSVSMDFFWESFVLLSTPNIPFSC